MVKSGEMYRHYKGGLYTVVGIASHSETLEHLVIYADQKGKLWARPQTMFEEILQDGRHRFEFVEKKDADSSPI